MTEEALPGLETAFGERVRRRLAEGHVIWFTTVDAGGTPQPNPVGFLLQDDGSILTYNSATAKRVKHIEARPRVALHFDGDGEGGDVVVFAGTARRVEDVPPPHQNDAWLAKYGDMMTAFCGSKEEFSKRFAVPVRVDLIRTRGR